MHLHCCFVFVIRVFSYLYVDIAWQTLPATSVKSLQECWTVGECIVIRNISIRRHMFHIRNIKGRLSHKHLCFKWKYRSTQGILQYPFLRLLLFWIEWYFTSDNDMNLGRVLRKRVHGHMRTAKAQISLCIFKVWSRHPLSANKIIVYYRIYEWKTCAGWFESASFAHVEGTFSLDATHWNICLYLNGVSVYSW